VKSTAKKVRAPKPESDDDESPTGVLPDRASDLGHQRRFRRGELVYFRVDTISPPDLSLPAITHWPALISEIRFRSEARGVAGGASMGNGGQVHHYWEYHLRPLGMFDKRHGLVRDVTDLIPWTVGHDLFDGDAGRDALAGEGARILLEGIEKEEERLGWDDRWGSRRPFGPMSWEDAAFRLVVAIKTGTTIAKSWCQTDRIDIMPEAILNDHDRALIASGKKGLFQGLWLGGERIWAEDVVRLKHSRLTLPPGLAPYTAGSGTESRAVCLRIQAIALESETQVPSPEDPEVKIDSWRCLLYGDVAELIPAPVGGLKALDSGWATFGAASGIKHPLVPNYKAPEGFAFRQINTDDSQITCDIGDIAGRLYADFLDDKTQNYYGAGEGRVRPGPRAYAVMGLAPGHTAQAENEMWIGESRACARGPGRRLTRGRGLVCDCGSREQVDRGRVQGLLRVGEGAEGAEAGSRGGGD
jgi:hypothetical protein